MTVIDWLRERVYRLIVGRDPVRHTIPTDHPNGATVTVTKTCGLCLGVGEIGPDPCPMCNATGAVTHPLSWHKTRN